MLNPRAGAPAANPDGRSTPEVSLDGRMWWYRTGTRGHRGRIRQETGLLVLFGVRRQGYSTYGMRADGLPIWGMSVEAAPEIASGEPDPVSVRALRQPQRNGW
jgi:hypothetical protein